MRDEAGYESRAKANQFKNGGKLLLRKPHRHFGKQKLVVGRVSKLEGDILEFEHGGTALWIDAALSVAKVWAWQFPPAPSPDG